uniref:Succinate dehydrogenase subunit 4 n=1 Tax=Gracilariopsis longissima TaxID=172976 RepID=A0A345UBJ8_9FLOR|nr:succinate dehydrogenase subunit 4 [Gracilariopsis longissima]AXI97834.1 succinate dehydrogenase subunit 4 [Gracilariopsis longissima]UAD89936.1 succinate dehydrogenase subunit 4 [Gracilariopsis longissima]
MFDINWLLLRLVTFFILGGILIDLEIFVFPIGFLFLHISLGLKTILNDYIHINKIKKILLVLVRISSIEISRYALELLL